MIEKLEQRNKANELRKNGHYDEAFQIYRDLWKLTNNDYYGAGILHCLRKLEKYDDALKFSDDLKTKKINSVWCKNEIVWTLISGVLDKYQKNEPLKNVIQTAEEILKYDPEDLALKKVVFKVLKTAKEFNNWKVISDWLCKVDPKKLSNKPIIVDSGKEGWCDQAIWYNYCLNVFIKSGKYDEAVNFVNEIENVFPKQKKYFLRGKAKALYLKGDLSESSKIYNLLINVRKPDWWLLHEYALIIKDLGDKNESLKLLYKAALSNTRLELIVSLLEDIGLLCMELEKYEESRDHFILCKFIRDKNGWKVKDNITNAIKQLNKIIGDNKLPSSIKEAINVCREKWKLTIETNYVLKSTDKRNIKKGLLGKISLGGKDRVYSYIVVNTKESFFCFKSDLPTSANDGDEVIFDAIPSFDKKKNRESWKASNIKLNKT